MNDINKVIDEMPEEVYQRLLSATELGKWDDGTVLTEPQRESTLQVVMLYQARKLQQTEHFTIAAGGNINELSKSELKKQFKGEPIAEFKEADL
ncbi:YeaC family protein [Shewanella frigidimarina]|uniref:YeaC family protein n=1 Tax=Shewanella frigidimarina TaxID=56812 RepID=UPI003D7AA4F8